jgi:hypothetical protein
LRYKLPRAGSDFVSDVVWIWSVVRILGSGPGHIGDISGPQLFICKVFMLGVKSFDLSLARFVAFGGNLDCSGSWIGFF